MNIRQKLDYVFLSQKDTYKNKEYVFEICLDFHSNLMLCKVFDSSGIQINIALNFEYLTYHTLFAPVDIRDNIYFFNHKIPRKTFIQENVHTCIQKTITRYLYGLKLKKQKYKKQKYIFYCTAFSNLLENIYKHVYKIPLNNIPRLQRTIQENGI